jgi:hypothetical protein
MLETMINHIASQVLLSTNSETGLWFLHGIAVQLAVSMGYHRDPSNLPNISPFAGEMRRRVWTVIAQMDLQLSNQVGLPRLLRTYQSDVAEPRNLLDTDLDPAAAELLPSQPEMDMTPVLFGLANGRLDRISGPIGDLVTDTQQEHPYADTMALDEKLGEAQSTLPLIFQWQPLGQSFMVSPRVLLCRVWLQLCTQRLVIWLHRKYLSPLYAQATFAYSRNACVGAAIKISEFQQLLDEEMRPGGQLHSVRWMQSSLIQSGFLPGLSVLCYYVQLAKTTEGVRLDSEMREKIYGLLRTTYPM